MKINKSKFYDDDDGGFVVEYVIYTPGKCTEREATELLSETVEELPGRMIVTQERTTKRLARLAKDNDPRKGRSDMKYRVNPLRDERILNLRDWEVEELNHKFEGNWMYVGRGNKNKNQKRSPLANPFKRGNGKRGSTKYKRWLWNKIKKNDKEVMKALRNINEDTRVVCSAPYPCHGKVVLAAAEWVRKNKKGKTIKMKRTINSSGKVKVHTIEVPVQMK